MSQVKRKDNESIERLISRLRRLMLRSGKLKQVRTSRYHKKAPNRVLTRQKAAYRKLRQEQALDM